MRGGGIRVRITKAFQIGKYEVTQEQWQAVMDANLSYFRGASRPVERVSWDDIQEFLRRLNARNDGFRYRLPTEAEWEYAARAGTADKYAGARALGDVAWESASSSGQTQPVGQKQANTLGLHDMLGNAWEWCQDWHGETYYAASPADDPGGPASGTHRVVRGGSWVQSAWFVRVSTRFRFPPGDTYAGIGFRCVREAVVPPCTLSCQASGPVTAIAGAAVSFSASATLSGCTGSPTYNWTFGDGGSSAQQNPSYTYRQAGSFNWTLTASASGAAACTRTGAIAVSAPSCTAPAIVTQPAGRSVVSGSTAELTVTASGTGPLSFQWYEGARGNTARPVGSNSATLRTPALTAATFYWVRVSNACGQADSEAATIAILPPSSLTTGPHGMQFIEIAAGEYARGCSPSDGECSTNEVPAHRVRITRGFQIGKYEVTQEQWQAVMGSNPSNFTGAANPVESVSWSDVQSFLDRLNERFDGFRYRLPTEAEWEYAARAGSPDRYAGAQPIDNAAWHFETAGTMTHPVGQKRPNAWGLYDTLGNVWEWCQDWYAADYSAASPQADPVGPGSGLYRVIRGGSWADEVVYARVSSRNWYGPGNRLNSIGFRCVREPFGGACTAPVITVQPAARSVTPGSTADLAVAAAGTAPLSYQWFEGARGNTSRPVGTNSAAFRTPALSATTTYWVRVSNACGQTDSNAVAVTVSIAPPPSVNMIDFVGIPPGEFTMGCPPGDGDCFPNETPPHRVRITRGFQIGRYEVTQEQWQSVMGTNPSRFRGTSLPVENVSWTDVQGFIDRMNARNDGYRYRLPTEAEWEYAARAGASGRYGGADTLQEAGWYLDNAGSATHSVGLKRPNAWGLYDMLGNVFEWCQDRYGEGYYGESPQADPQGPSTGSARVMRGGAWNSEAQFARVFGRHSNSPDFRDANFGFRLVREAPPVACLGPAITVQPASRSVTSGSSAELAVTASGTAPLSFQWYEGARGNTARPVGSNSATLRTPALTAATSYWVRVSNACGHADSEAATVMVGAGSLRNDFGMEFVEIQPGEFMMGCSPGDTECWGEESPRHRVRITKRFQIGTYEVTQEQWQAVMGSNPSRFQGTSLPVEATSWNNIQEFMGRLNGRNDGFRYRLPTEAEWEYAARAGATDRYGGAAALNDVAWYAGNSGDRTHPIGEKRPNAWGIHDMLGNVWEWCQDRFSGGYYAVSPESDPLGPGSGTERVLRGGSWGVSASYLRVSNRFRDEPDYRINLYGFRCVREVIP